MVNVIDEVLSDLGWNDGFRIPIANADNKRLEEEIEHKTRLRATLKTQLETARERIQDIRKHAGDLRQEHSQNQRLLCAHSAQVEAEQQLHRLAQSNESKISHEIKHFERQTRETTEKIGTLQQSVARMTKKLELTKKRIQLDKDKLACWEDKLNRKEEKNAVIEEFVKSDEKIFKKIEQERQTLSEQAEVYRQAVMKIVGDVHEGEMTLERTARLYSQAIKDRRQLMDQWSQSVRVLTQRDKSIFSALKEIGYLREIAKEKMNNYQEAERYFEIQQSENKELESNIKLSEKELFYCRSERQKLLNNIELCTTQVHCQKKILQDLARRTQDTRSNLKRKKLQVEEKFAKLEDIRKRVTDLNETLKNIEGQKMSSEERAVQLQDILEMEEKRKSAIAKEIKRQQALIYRTGIRLDELQGKRKMLSLRQQTESKRWEQLLVEQTKEEKALKEKKDRVYQADTELQKAELRLQNILGKENDKEEQEAKQKRFKQLQKIFQDKTDMVKTLQLQLSQVESDIRKISNSIAANNEEIERLKNKRQELLVLIEGGEKQLRTAQSNYEERKVEENLVELKLREAGKIILKVDDKLYDLEKYAIQMEAVMQERKSDIKVQKESLNLQRRVILNDCAELRNLIAERKIRVQQLQTRYDIHVATLGTNPEDGSPLTTAYIMIQSAQERYVLQERGDKLDYSIRKAEHEIRSMENTLKLVNACNNKYKMSLSMVDDKGPEKAEQKMLDDELFNILELVRQKRQDLDRALNDCKKMEENCEQLDKDIEKIKEDKENKQQSVATLEHQINDQRDKIFRANKNLRKVLKDIQNKCICASEATILMQERDIAVRELQELNTLALQRITEFTIRYVEAEAYVKKLLAQRNIEIPCSYYLKSQSTSMASSRCQTASSCSTNKTWSRSNLSQQNFSLREGYAIGNSFIGFDSDLSGIESEKSSKSKSITSQRRPIKKQFVKR